ncbi:MAG: helix-turn-helix transcriptional regulator [Bacteriovorax sp.]|nr:helix-turn-helix transcriptional regulator [Bacteriovorax sp.]
MRNKVKIMRVTEDWTQEELAEKLGVSRQTIIAIENNKYLPSLPLAFNIAKTFKSKIEDIFIYKEEK